ncbi:S8 family serine peptidase [Bacteroidota bacterium]
MNLVKYAVFFFLFTSNILLSVNIKSNEDAQANSITTDKFGNDIAYNIYVPGKRLIDGTTTMAKVYSIPVLPETEYLPNTIHIKTRNFHSLSKNDTKLPQLLSSSIDDLNIENINAPFESFNSASIKACDDYGISRIYELTYSSEKNPYEVCKELMKNPEVEYAVPIFRTYIHDFTPNDPELSKQWALGKIEAYKAWDISQGDSSIIIAITDSGTDYNHEDLSDNIWYNPNEIPDDGIDNDSNGYIDDFRGWDFVGNITASQAISGAWKPDNDPKPGFWHGTHVAGCAAATGNNSKGIAGPGFKCKIMALKCGIDQTNSRSIFRGYDAILYAAQMGAHVINCSWGGDGSSPVGQEIINTAVNMGSVVVVSAGNSYKNIDYGNSYPAGYDNVLCVGATRSNDRKVNFSNYGHLVTVYGPGHNIYSTMPGNKYQNQSGTSMSGPVVAGICGQVIAAHPDWTPKQVMHQIRSTSEDVMTTDPSQRPIYYGRVNAYRALSYNNPALGAYEKIPGISVSEILSEGVDVLTDYNPATFRIKITNYLSIGRRIKVKISALNKYLNVSKSKVDIGTLDEMQSDTFSLDVRLLESTPWYEGKVDILLEYESDSYTDFEIIQLPIKLDTRNQFSLKYIFPEAYLPVWNSAICTDFNDLILVGSYSWTYGIFYKYGQAYNPGFKISEKPLYCVHALDANTIIAGSGGNPTEIVKTNNGGVNWSSANVSDITNFVNAVYLFDNVDGVFAGDPLNGAWGVATTNNGGQSWVRSYKVPDPLSGEAGLAGCFYGTGNLFWFGTNKGRIILTKDKGKNWAVSTLKQNGFVHKIHFIDGLSGLALYTNSQSDNEMKVATTWDGGYNWDIDKFNFATLGVRPIYIYSPPGSNMVTVLCQGGEIYSTTDYGKSWQAVLTYKFATASFGAAYGVSSECRMWSGETELTSLDFEYLPENPNRTLTVSPEGVIDFGDIVTGKTRTITLSLENAGNMIIHIDSTEIEHGEGVYTEEFKLTFPVTNEIGVGEKGTTRIKFAPKMEGDRVAKYIIYSDADENVLNISLIGNGIDGVKEIAVTTDTIVDFDSVEIGTSAEYTVKYKNKGTVYFNVDDIVLEPVAGSEGVFEMGDFTGFEIAPNQTSEISITFTPAEEGLKEANMIITSDAEDVLLPIIGFGQKPVSVEDNILDKYIIEDLSPNPCGDEISAKIYSLDKGNINISLYNNLGQQVQNFDRQLQSGNNILRINTTNIVNGSYYLKIIIDGEVYTKKFIKKK